MASNTYSETKPEYRWIADKLEDMGLEYKIYNYGIQYNVTDADGVIQSFYPSTGTILFYASNDRKDRRTKTLRDKDLDYFLSYITKSGAVKKLFA